MGFRRLAMVAALVLGPAVAVAERAALEVDLDGDGRPEQVELRPVEEGWVELVVAGSASGARTRTDGLEPSGAELRRIELGRGRSAGHLRVPRGTDRAFEAVLFSRARGARPSLVWAGETGLRGDRGSRWGDRLLVEDLTGDGVPEILVAAVADEVPLCGVPEPELFPRALDPDRGELRAVELNRLRRLEARAEPVVATYESPGPTGPPTVAVATFAIASTIEGDRGAVEGLAAPRALADGDPSTVWVEGRPGPGSGEFVTARLLPGPYRVRAVAVTLVPSDGEGGFSALRSFVLVLDGPAGPRRLEVEVPGDPAARPGVPVWVTLPEPVQSSCLSLVLGRSAGGGPGPTRTAVAQLAVYTDLDFEGGEQRVVDLLGEPDSEHLLRALGGRALPLLRERWTGLDAGARRRAVRVLSDLREPAAADLLADAALGADAGVAAEARRGLVVLGPGAFDALEAELGSELSVRRTGAASLLAAIGTPGALEVLARRLGQASATDARALRAALRAALPRAGSEGRELLLAAAEEASPGGLPLLAVLAPPEPAERPRFARLVLAALTAAEGFEDRYRALDLASAAGPDPALATAVVAVAGEGADQYLRARAVEALGALHGRAGSLPSALERAADDQLVRVRLAAARALGLAGAAGAGLLERLLASDPWPLVRAAAAESLADLGAARVVPSLVRGLEDGSPLVRRRAAAMLGRLRAPEAVGPLEALARRAGAGAVSREAAARALGASCLAEAVAPASALVSHALDGRARPDDVRVGAASASALAPYRGEEVTALLARASARGAPGLRLAAIEALGGRPEPEARAALEALAEDPLPPLRAAAAAALRRLDEGAPRLACPR